MVPRRQVMTRDTLALGGGFRLAPHQEVLALCLSVEAMHEALGRLAHLARLSAVHIGRLEPDGRSGVQTGGVVTFIGHGRSLVWRELKDFLKERLGLAVSEFNSVSAAGVLTVERLTEMLNTAAFAFIVMTGEDEQADGALHVRQNVIHEAGLFQGRLGFGKAIILLEEGCSDFSNIHGLGVIEFAKGKIGSSFEEVRRVLEREKMVAH
jgi:predicted nucleotide-binding protein